MNQSEADSGILVIPTLTRTQVAERIAIRLAEQLGDTKLSGWAFDRFYRVELGEEQLEPGYEDLIGHVLDELMFADDRHFQIGEFELRALAARLEGI